MRLRTVRHVAQYLHAEDPQHDLPPAHVFGRHRARRRPPRLFTPQDIEQLLQHARDLPSTRQQPPLVYRTLFGLLAATGLRISEALALRVADLTPEGLVVRHTKFGKSRLLPLHATTRQALEGYLAGHPGASAEAHLFLSRRGRALRVTTVRGVFGRLMRRLGIGQHPSQPRPRLHDLRVHFANQVLATSREPPTDLSAHLIALTTYLGHTDVRNSYWYLEATPVILAQISLTCEAFVKGAPR